MAQSPYGTDGDETDIRRIKLQMQALNTQLQQLQHRISSQSSNIEELHGQIEELQQVIQKKDETIKEYKNALREQEKVYASAQKRFEEEKEELLKKLKDKDQTITNLETRHDAQLREFDQKRMKKLEVNNYIDTLIAYYKKPTSEEFLDSLITLVKYCSDEGTPEQRVLGKIIQTNLPVKSDYILEQVAMDEGRVNRILETLKERNLIKKAGQGYLPLTSEFADVTNVSDDWSGFSAIEAIKNLKSLIMVGTEHETLSEAFVNVRDLLMQKGLLAPMDLHRFSRIINNLKRRPMDPNELIEVVEQIESKVNS